ncbi:type-F conjugative transfer system protein TraW [Candidatus Phycosocius bacilliformis]|nr:type-F conjugative transfer system protein TraW [Candidatus Phycosocius bacilliformis]
MRPVLALCLVAFTLCASPALAKDLGMRGAVFTIEEPDLLEVLAAKLGNMVNSGEWDQIAQESIEGAKRRMMRPEPVSGLRRATKTVSRSFDPSITVDRDLADHRGVVFARAGTRVNPLEMIGLREPLFFVDGDDSSQVRWVLAEQAKRSGKIILVNGSPVEFMRAHKKRAFFDQGGVMTRRFDLKAVPSVIEQDEFRLRITEVGP